MHLALLTYSFPPQTGGVQTYLFEVVIRLSTTYKITVVTPIADALVDCDEFNLFPVSNGHFVTICQALRKLKPDRILIGHSHPQLLLAAKLMSPLKGYGAIAYGNDFLAAQNHWHHPLFNRLLAQARPLLSISKGSANRLQAIGLPKPWIIYPGTDPMRFTPRSAVSPPFLTLLTIGRLVPRKGIDTTLHAVAQLLPQFPQLRYQIGGSGPDRERLEQLVHDLNITFAVTFLGRVPEDDLPEIYRQADIFVMPTRELVDEGSVEGFGIVYLEASASGLSVVASHSGGAAEAVRHEETGLLVPPDDSATLAKTLTRLLADERLRRRLGQNGRHWVETEMNWDRAAQQMQAALESAYANTNSLR